jgi:putative flippase GtrA
MAAPMPQPLLRLPGIKAVDLGALARFATVGVCTTALDAILFTALTAYGIPPAPANIASYSCGIALAYVLNGRWTFRTEGSPGRALRFYLLMFAGLLLSTLIVAALSMILPPLVAKLISVPIVFVYNYTASRRWVFGPPAPGEPSLRTTDSGPR